MNSKKNIKIIRQQLRDEFWKGGKRSKLTLIDRWFGVGNGKIAYGKYLIAYLVILFPVVETTIIMAVAYAITAFVMGVMWDWYNFGPLAARFSNIINKDMFDRIQNGKAK